MPLVFVVWGLPCLLGGHFVKDEVRSFGILLDPVLWMKSQIVSVAHFCPIFI